MAASSAGERLNLGPIAVVGVSDRKGQFGAYVVRELRKRGYTVHPVHPTLSKYDDQPVFASLTDIPGEVDLVVVTVKPEKAMPVVVEAKAKGVKRIWFQQGADFTEAAAAAREAGLETIDRACVLMYADPVDGIHTFHRMVWKLIGAYKKPNPLSV